MASLNTQSAAQTMTVTSKDGSRSAVMPMTNATFAVVFNGRVPMAGGSKIAAVMTEAEGLDWLYVEQVRNRLLGVTRGASKLVAPSPRAERMANAMKASLFSQAA
jgi:hypothetical protein